MAGELDELVDALRIQQKVNVSAQGSTSQGCASWFSFICPHSSHYIYIYISYYILLLYIYIFIILYIYIYVMRYGHIQFEHDKTYQKHPNRNSFIKSIYLDPPEANVAWSGLWEAFEGSRCCTSVQMRTVVPSVPSESSAHDFHDQWEIFRIQLMEVR